jgi:hypothetical protein
MELMGDAEKYRISNINENVEVVFTSTFVI